MANNLSNEITYFQEHQKQFAEEHHGSFVLIHQQSVLGFYPSGGDAYSEAQRRGLSSGTFLIRECVWPEEETTAIFHSRVAG